MINNTLPKRPVNLGIASRPVRILIAAVVVLAITAIVALKPRWGLLAAAPAIVKIHLACAVGALLLGTSLMLWRKGRTFHRVGGWLFVTLMMVVAAGSLFITGLNGPHWSPIHLLSLFTLVMVPLGVIFARRHLVFRHRRVMTGLYFGALIIAGLFTFFPGRLMWRVFFGA